MRADLERLATPRPRLSEGAAVDPVVAEVIRGAMETVCFEMARQLDAAGDTVALLIVIDAGPPGGGGDRSLATKALNYTRIHGKQTMYRAARRVYRKIGRVSYGRLRRAWQVRFGPPEQRRLAHVDLVRQACQRAYLAYDAQPCDVPILQIGETLFGAKFGLPDLRNFAWAEVIYDEGDPLRMDGTQSLTRLFDPLSPRILQLRAAGDNNFIEGPGYAVFEVADPDSLFSDISTANNLANKVFVDLPYTLRSRLEYDPLNKNLRPEVPNPEPFAFPTRGVRKDRRTRWRSWPGGWVLPACSFCSQRA